MKKKKKTSPSLSFDCEKLSNHLAWWGCRMWKWISMKHKASLAWHSTFMTQGSRSTAQDMSSSLLYCRLVVLCRWNYHLIEIATDNLEFSWNLCCFSYVIQRQDILQFIVQMKTHSLHAQRCYERGRKNGWMKWMRRDSATSIMNTWRWI